MDIEDILSFLGKCYYQSGRTGIKVLLPVRKNFSWKTFTRGRKQYAHYKRPEKHV